MSNDSKQAFTPGPWRVVIDDDGNPLSGRPSVMASNELDCGIVHWDGFIQTYWRSARGDREIHANAQLIAAAPEMYEALKKAEQLYQVGLIKAPDGLFNEVNKLRAAALLKADGASS